MWAASSKKKRVCLVANEQTFRSVFAIDVRTRCEAIEITPEEHTVKLRDVATGEVTTHAYDKLVLSPGAVSVRPPLPGIDLPGIFHVRTVPDAREICEWIEKGNPFLAGIYRYSGFQTLRPKPRAVVIGGGFIGLEMVENLVHRGFDVTLVEMLDQVLPPIDKEHAQVVEAHLKKHGVHLALADGVAGFKQAENGAIDVQTQSGATYPADVVILALGVRPDTTLAKMAGLEIGERGGIRVDDQMRTSDPDIFAVGDAIEVKDFVTGEWSLIALAGPANRQGRIAADVISGRDSHFRGTQGTAIVGLFGAAVAWTGVSEKTLQRLGDDDYEKIYLYPNSHAGYYPGAKPLAMKIIFRKSDGRLLGAQALGEEGVDKRISAFAAHAANGRHDLRSGRSRTVLRPRLWQRQRPGQLCRHGGRRCAQGRYAAQSLGRSQRAIPAGCARTGGVGCGKCAGCAEHPAWTTASTPGRTAARSRDSCHLPFRSACLLCDAHPVAAWFQSQKHLRRDVVAGAQLST